MSKRRAHGHRQYLPERADDHFPSITDSLEAGTTLLLKQRSLVRGRALLDLPGRYTWNGKEPAEVRRPAPPAHDRDGISPTAPRVVWI